MPVTRWLRGSFLVVGLVAVATRPAATQNASDTEVRVTRLSQTVYLLQGISAGSTYGGNVLASVGPDGVLLVDTNYAALSGHIRRALITIAGAERPVRLIINTHWHRDHAEGNKEFGHAATIIAHRSVRTRLSAQQTLFGQVIEPYPHFAQPTITFDDSLTLHFNGEDIRVVHVPNAHTDGDAVVLFTTSNVVHTGDIYIGPVFPFVDADHGGTVDGLEQGVRTIVSLSRPDTTIVPGHRLLTDIQSLKQYDDMLLQSLETVRGEMRERRTLAEIQKRGFPLEWERWEWDALPIRTWIEYVYRSLNRH
jgi:glyoxylase-like metal-dependent hydrolase (beta-lactamase superfamily II)